MRTRKLFAFLLALSLFAALSLTGAFTPRAQAAEVVASGTCGEDLTWTLDDNGTLTISGTKDMKDYYYSYPNASKTLAPWYSYTRQITSVVIEAGVSSIGGCAFYGCSKLTDITIPDSVTRIGSQAFVWCTQLSSITIPESVTSIGSQPFMDCTSLTSAGPIGGDCSYKFGWKNAIPENAFSGCTGLTDITIPDSITSIGDNAFEDCTSLTGITIPDGVTSIGSRVFERCTGLTSIIIPDSVTSIGDDAFFYCTQLISAGPIGGDYNLKFGWKDTIPDYAFSGCSGLTDITIPDSATSIGDYAFSGCSSLTSVTIPDGVTSIGDGVVANCSGLTNLEVSSENLSYYSVDNCIIETSSKTLIAGCNTSIIPEDSGITHIGHSAFKGCTGLTNVTIPDGVTSIGDYAFSGCSGLASVTVPDGVTSIGKYAFSGCKSMSSIIIPSSVTTIGSEAFCRCSSLTGIIIPDGIANIGSRTFEGCTSLTNIVIPDGVAIIDFCAFKDCTGLTSITIPSSVFRIGMSAFSNCTNLTTLYYGGNEERLNYISIGTGNDALLDATIYYNENDTFLYGGTCGFDLGWALNGEGILTISGTGDMTNYSYYSSKNAPWYPYRKQITNVVINSGVTSVGNYAFRDCTGLISITIPDSVSSIGEYVFQNCTGLTSVTIPDGITSIGNYMFENCTSLTSITIPDSVTSIGGYAFSRCTSLTSITIPDSVTSIGGYAFSRCTSLTSITIPDSVTSIGDSAFSRCTSLTSITIPDSVTSIGSFAFEDCTSLTGITIPDGITSIGNSAFWYCTSLTSITIPDSITSIGNSVFYGCSSLTGVTIPDSITSFGGSAFKDCTGLTSITIPVGVTLIGDSAFSGCTGLVDVYYGGNENRWYLIDISGFSNSELLTATIHFNANDTYTEPIYSGICGADLTWELKNGILSISGTGDMTNYSRSSDVPWYSVRRLITSVVLENGITSIGDYAFCDCSRLTSITLPDGLTRICWNAFERCISLNGISFPESVTGIYDYSFSRCTSLTSIAIPDGVGGIGNGVFSGCTSLTSITLPKDTTRIGNNAFSGCSSLTNISIPDSVTIIEQGTFFNCTGLTSITIPDSVTHIQMSAFEGCTGLTSVYVPEGVTSIDLWAFRNCTSLTSLTIPNSVTYISFPNAGCTGLISAGPIGGGYNLEYGWTDTIPQSAFAYCASLTCITIPDSISSIGVGAFEGCSALTDVYYYGSENDWAEIGIEGNNDNLLNATIHFAKASITIDTQPSDQAVSANATVKFSVEASGDNLTYQWQYRTSQTGTWKNSSASTAKKATIKINATTSKNGYQYRCVITDGEGNVVESDPATLYVLSITTQPEDARVVEGKTAKFTVKATGGDLTYQWQYRTSSTGSWKNSTASTATTATLKTTAKTSRNGYQYRCLITDSAGNVVESEPATLYVLGVTTQPDDAEVSVGTTVKFKVKATGDGLTYQWQYRTSETGTWKNSSASTAKKATVKVNATTGKNGYQYRCEITDSAGNVVYSEPATLTILSPATVTVQPTDAYIVAGDTANFTVVVSGDGLTYQWQYRTSSTGSWKDSSASSAVTATVKVTGKTSRNGYQYRCKITDSAGNVVYSEPATLYVLGIKTQPASQTVSAGTSVKFTVKATGDGLTYQWQYRTSSSGGWKNSGASTATKATIKINGTTSKNGYQYRCKITDSAGNVVYSDAATLTVN